MSLRLTLLELLAEPAAGARHDLPSSSPTTSRPSGTRRPRRGHVPGQGDGGRAASRDVLDEPQHPYTQALIAAARCPSRAAGASGRARAGRRRRRRSPIVGCPFQDRCPAVMPECRVGGGPVSPSRPGRRRVPALRQGATDGGEMATSRSGSQYGLPRGCPGSSSASSPRPRTRAESRRCGCRPRRAARRRRSRKRRPHEGRRTVRRVDVLRDDGRAYDTEPVKPAPRSPRCRCTEPVLLAQTVAPRSPSSRADAPSSGSGAAGTRAEFQADRHHLPARTRSGCERRRAGAQACGPCSTASACGRWASSLRPERRDIRTAPICSRSAAAPTAPPARGRARRRLDRGDERDARGSRARPIDTLRGDLANREETRTRSLAVPFIARVAATTEQCARGHGRIHRARRLRGHGQGASSRTRRREHGIWGSAEECARKLAPLRGARGRLAILDVRPPDNALDSVERICTDLIPLLERGPNHVDNETDTHRVVEALYAAYLAGDPRACSPSGRRRRGALPRAGHVPRPAAVRRFMDTPAASSGSSTSASAEARRRRRIACAIWRSQRRPRRRAWENHGVDVVRVRGGKVVSLHENNDVTSSTRTSRVRDAG